MLSETTRKYLIKSLKAGSFLGSFPYEWDEGANIVKMRQRRRHLILWTVNFLLEITFECFVLFRLVQAVGTDDGSVGSVLLINLQYKAIAYILPILFQVATILRWEEYCTFMNLCMEFYRNVQGKYVEEEWKKQQSGVRNSCDSVMPYIFYLGILIAVLQSLVAVTRPEQLTLFTSLLADPRGSPLTVRFPIAALQAYLVFAFCFKMQFYTFAMLAYVSPAALILSELRLDSTEKLTSVKLRYTRDFVAVYRSMELLHGMFNKLVARIELPCVKAVLMGATILGTYGCARIHGPSVMVMAVVATASLMTLKATYGTMSILFESSTAVLGEWYPRMEQQGLLGKRTWRSLRPLGTSVGGFYDVRKIVILVVLSVVTEQTVSLLIAF